MILCNTTRVVLTFLCLLGNEVITVKTPAFAESVTEGDVRWEKGTATYMFVSVFLALIQMLVAAR